MKTFKGFNKDMTCKGFQYEEGKSYEEDKALACRYGFHACEYPLDCFSYYSPNSSIYREVEQDGEISQNNNDTKVASTKIKIGAEIGIAGLVKAAIEYTTKRVKKEADSSQDCGASSATGYKGASSATGDYGASSATGYKGASSATGDYGASSATGNCGASSATGYKGASSAEDKETVAIAWGYKGKAELFFEEMSEHGIKWCSGDSLDDARWDEYGSDTCYGFFTYNDGSVDNGICYGTFGSYEDKKIEYTPKFNKSEPLYTLTEAREIILKEITEHFKEKSV